MQYKDALLKSAVGKKTQFHWDLLRIAQNSSWNWAPEGQESGAFIYCLPFLTDWGMPLGTLILLHFKLWAVVEVDSLTAQGKFEHTWHCPLQLHLTSEIGQVDVKEGTSHSCYKYLGRNIKIRKAWKIKWQGRDSRNPTYKYMILQKEKYTWREAIGKNNPWYLLFYFLFLRIWLP